MPSKSLLFYICYSFAFVILIIFMQIILNFFLNSIFFVMILSTLISFCIKYLIDNFFFTSIFFVNNFSIASSIRYLITSILCTILFWLVEYISYLFFNNFYLGLLCGGISLLFIFALKYYLDKNYVFIQT
jgi:hypothetical protein